MPTWKYVGKLASGQPVRGNMNADSEDGVRKKLEAMSISCESVISVAGALDEPKVEPQSHLTGIPEESPESSETAKRVMGAIAGLGDTYRVAGDLAPRPSLPPGLPSEKPKTKRRESLVVGTLETIIRQCEPLLARQNGAVKHALMRNDAIGKLHVMLVVEHDEEKQNAQGS